MPNQKVLVVGGGIGGMAFAIRMRELGWHVDLIEIDPQWRVYGAGISVTAPTYRAFKRLGIVQKVNEQGYGSTKGVRICTPSGHVIAENPMEPIEPGLPTHGGIMRPVLHQIMSERTRASGTNIRLGVTLAHFEDLGDEVEVQTSDGQTRRYALVVGADGAFSRLRSTLFPEAPATKFTGQYCWRLVAERRSSIDQCNFYMAGVVTAGVMPVTDSQMYMFLLNHEDAKVRLDEATQWQRLKDLMAPFSGVLGDLRDGLSVSSAIISRPLEAILLPRPWHRGRVVLIGDAAHATTPHLASGAGIAIEDALVLGEELSVAPGVEQALLRFEERRWDRCRMVVENSVRIGEMEQTHADPALLKSLMAESEVALRQEI